MNRTMSISGKPIRMVLSLRLQFRSLYTARIRTGQQAPASDPPRYTFLSSPF